jgi:hypothetical protein
MPRGAQPGERRGGRAKGTPNRTPSQKVQDLAVKVAKAEARAKAKVIIEPLEHKLAKDALDWGMQYCMRRAAFCRPALPGEPRNPNEDEAEHLKWLGRMGEFGKALLPFQSPKFTAIAIQTPAAESENQPRLDSREQLWQTYREMRRRGELALEAVPVPEAKVSDAAPASEPVPVKEDDADGIAA